METSIGRGCAHGMPVLVRVLVRVGWTNTPKLANLRAARVPRVCRLKLLGLRLYIFTCLTSSSSTLKRRKGDAQNKEKNDLM